MEAWLYLLRWIHFLAGITWIGLLYYFNLVQTPFFAETDPAVRSGAIQKLVPRALWWFRWGAMGTFLAGLLMRLSDRQITDLFDVSRMASRQREVAVRTASELPASALVAGTPAAEWVRAFKQKRDVVATTRCR